MLFFQRKTARAIPLRPLINRWFVLALAAAVAATAFFLLYGDPLVMPPKKLLVGLSEVMTRFGYGAYLLVPTGVLILLLLPTQRLALSRMAHATIAAIAVQLTLVFSAVAIPGALSALAKGLIGRARPKFFHGSSAAGFDPLAWKAASESFPSGHTTIAFATAVVLGALFPRLRVPFFVIAVMVGLSRIALRAHYPSDALAGAIVGVVFATLIVRAFAARRLGVAVTLDGTIKPKAMPSIGRLGRLAAEVLATLRGRVPARPLARNGEIFERN
ncbi:MAG TPA: phosphatase PAP2 family protein [Xanthobacteraceae bacterium]|nr:phosphatase PAP2 family protein [Xanthobacteraceae bacterium]